MLGSLNLTKFIINPFYDNVKFDWDKYIEVIHIFQRLLDNVVEINGLPLQKQQDEIFNKRRRGLGVTGLGSLFTMMKIKYGSIESINFTEKLIQTLAIESYKEGVNLAKEKGGCPILDDIENRKLFIKSEYLQNVLPE